MTRNTLSVFIIKQCITHNNLPCLHKFNHHLVNPASTKSKLKRGGSLRAEYSDKVIFSHLWPDGFEQNKRYIAIDPTNDIDGATK